MKARHLRLWHGLREHATNWAVGGVLIAATGFAPEEWFARTIKRLQIPENALHLWSTGIDVRIVPISLGVAVVVGNLLRRRTIREPPLNAAATGTAHAHVHARPVPLPDRPPIAVLPFANLSGDSEQEYFSDGVADDVITELSRVRWLFVIARNSSFAYRGSSVDLKQIGRELGVRYVLEGSVRRSGQRIRVNAQLIDAESGNHVWAQRYDRKVEDVFAVQDEITLAITRAIEPAVDEAEQWRVLRKPPGNLGAWETYQRGMWHLSRFKPEDEAEAGKLFASALELDPTLAAAHTGRAVMLMRAGTVFASRPLLEALRLAGEEARKALELDPTDAESLAVRALAAGSNGDYATCFDNAERALSINPSCATAYRAKGWLQIFTGKPAEGRETILYGTRLDPRMASNPTVRSQIAMSYYFERNYEMTVAETKRLIADRPDQPLAYRWLAAALGQLGRIDEAHDALDKAIGIAPELFRLFVEQRMPWMGEAVHDHMLEGLRKAGWKGTGEVTSLSVRP